MTIVDQFVGRAGDWVSLTGLSSTISPRGGTVAAPPGSAPSPSGEVLSSSTIRWTWTAVDNTDGYRISLDGGAWLNVGNVRQYDDLGLSAEQTRTFKVLAYNESGDGPESATISRTTDAAPFSASWQAAWDSNDLATIEAWYQANAGADVATLEEQSSISGFSTSSDGQVIENERVTGTITIKHKNVTLRNVLVDLDGTPWYGITRSDDTSGTVLENVTVRNAFTSFSNTGLSSAILAGTGWTISYCDVSGFEDGIKAQTDTIIEYTWVHDLFVNRDDPHADCHQSRGGSNLTILRCLLDADQTSGNAATICTTGTSAIDNYRFEENVFTGGNYTVYLIDKGAGFGRPTNCRIVNNRWAEDTWNFGPLSVDNDASNTWSGNRTFSGVAIGGQYE